MKEHPQTQTDIAHYTQKENLSTTAINKINKHRKTFLRRAFLKSNQINT